MEGCLTHAMLRKVFFCNLNTVDSNFFATMALAYGHMSANDTYQALDERAKSSFPSITPERTL